MQAYTRNTRWTQRNTRVWGIDTLKLTKLKIWGILRVGQESGEYDQFD